MVYKILNKEDNLITSNKIKNYFINGGEFIVIHNVDTELTDDEIINYYTKLNKLIGKIQPVDIEKYTDSCENDIWVDVKYDINIASNTPWRSNGVLKLHTDNTLSNSVNYANLTELVCLEPSQYSGHTTLISNKLVVELIKYVDEYENTNLFQKILDFEINFSLQNKKRNILQIVKNTSVNKEEYIFCFNHLQTTKASNNDKQTEIITQFDNFLQEKIMMSSLMHEIKLKRGEAIIFNDEKVIHGRRSVIGNRHYIKCSILMSEICLFDYKKL